MILCPNITVDLYKPYPLVILEVPQYNIGRGALVTLTAGGSVVIPTNEIIETYALKPDGTKVYNTAILAGNQVQINFSEQMTAVDGILQCELQMIDALGHSITTPIFAVRILPSNIDAKAITSSDDFQALVDALAEVEEIKSTIQKGDPGEAATIQVGTVTASDPGSNPQVNNSGTEQDAVFDFVFPRGDPGSMWYQGDRITGTSTSGTVFSGSGIANAKLNDMYLNTGSGADRGNVYVCTLAGNASTAQWAYKQNIMGPTGPAGTANASSVAYNNETSGLTADNVQEAVDELNQNISNCYDKNQVDGFLDGYKFRILQAQLQFANGSAIWEDDLSDLGGALYFASVNGLAVNDTFACSITNGTAASARLIVWELNTPGFSGAVNIRILVVCK